MSVRDVDMQWMCRIGNGVIGRRGTEVSSMKPPRRLPLPYHPDVRYFYLAVSDYGTRDQATQVPIPIPHAFKPLFIGQILESLAEWLRNKPEDVTLKTKFFALLHKRAKDGNV